MTINNPPPTLQLARLPSRIYPTYSGFFGTTGAVPAIDLVYAYPFVVEAPISVATLVMRIVAGGADSAVKMGIWANDASRPFGAPLAASTGDATTANNTTITANVTDFALPSGLYWAGSKFTGTLPTAYNCNVGSMATAWQLGFDALASNAAAVGLSTPDTYSNALPTFTGGETWTTIRAGGVPLVFLGT